MKDISEKRLSDYMAEQIADEILSGRIPGGSQLKQEELAEAFEASRIRTGNHRWYRLQSSYRP